MVYDTGTRVLAAVMFLLSLTIILWPICFPLGCYLIYKARQNEKAMRRR